MLIFNLNTTNCHGGLRNADEICKRNYNCINARLNAMKVSLVHFYFYATS